MESGSIQTPVDIRLLRSLPRAKNVRFKSLNAFGGIHNSSIRTAAPQTSNRRAHLNGNKVLMALTVRSHPAQNLSSIGFSYCYLMAGDVRWLGLPDVGFAYCLFMQHEHTPPTCEEVTIPSWSSIATLAGPKACPLSTSRQAFRRLTNLPLVCTSRCSSLTGSKVPIWSSSEYKALGKSL